MAPFFLRQDSNQVCLAPQPEFPRVVSWCGGPPPAPPQPPHAPHLHDCVVDGDEVGEQVQVPGSEDESEEDLALPRDACGQRGTGDRENTDF